MSPFFFPYCALSSCLSHSVSLLSHSYSPATVRTYPLSPRVNLHPSNRGPNQMVNSLKLAPKNSLEKTYLRYYQGPRVLMFL